MFRTNNEGLNITLITVLFFTACHRISKPIGFGGLGAKQRHRTWLEGRGEADRKKFYEGGDLIR